MTTLRIALAAWSGIALACGQAANPEPAQLPDLVDSWYKVLQGEQHVGMIHESLLRDSKSGTTIYQRTERYKIALQDGTHSESRSVRANLDNTFVPTSLDSELHVDGTPSSLKISTDDAGTWVEVQHSSGVPSLIRRDPKERLQVLPELLLYDLRQNRTLGIPGQNVTRLLDPSGRVRQGVEVSLKVGETTKREYYSGLASVTEVSFIRANPASRLETELVHAYVDRYGRIVEATMRSGVKIMIAKGEMEALGQLDRDYAQRNRRITCWKQVPEPWFHCERR